MKKEKIISKFNIKNYSNQLEKVLAKKPFSENTKNLLLDMLYKIENSYEDYNDVKRDIRTRGEILEEIIEIIEHDCKDLQILKEKKSGVLRSEGKIATYPNTRKVLYELYQLKQKQFIIDSKYSVIKKSLESTLNQGYSINGSEIIRDFDGWAWNIQYDEIENKINNFLYQSLMLLVGNDFLCEWKNNEDKTADYIEKLIQKLESKYKKEKAEELTRTLFEISVINYAEAHADEKATLIKLWKEVEEEHTTYIKKIYLKNLTEEKKNLIGKIQEIDEITNNNQLLKQEFVKRNAKLGSTEQIFSLSNLADIMQEEKNELTKKLDVCNEKLDPVNYSNLKNTAESKLRILDEINLSEDTRKVFYAKVKEMIKLVAESLKIDADNFQEKEDLIETIYKIRYFKSIPIIKNKKIQDVINFSELEKYLITKACNEKVLNTISNDTKENYDITKIIFKTDIIKLEKIQVKLKRITEAVNTIEYYDEENKCTSIDIEQPEKLNIGIRKAKIFA